MLSRRRTRSSRNLKPPLVDTVLATRWLVSLTVRRHCVKWGAVSALLTTRGRADTLWEVALRELSRSSWVILLDLAISRRVDMLSNLAQITARTLLA